MLHWLGGSGSTWIEVSERLAQRGLRCVRVDLPGFGAAVDVPGFDVQAMADAVMETVRGLGIAGEPWLLAGHSMGGKVAALVARAAVDDAPGLAGLRGLVLVSPSPPGPEPMPDSTRKAMLQSLGQSSGDAAEDRRRARTFVTDNLGRLALPQPLEERAIDDVLRMNRAAFRAWLEGGSREDWGAHVGVLPLPALVFAGSEEPSLNPAAQRKHLLPHLANGAPLITLEATGHLGLLERVDEVIEHTVAFVTSLGIALEPESPKLGADFDALLHSDRTSPKTRSVMLQRLDASDTLSPGIFTESEQQTLRALVESVVPSEGFALAPRVEAHLASGHTDGTRADALPADVEAWRRGLHTLDAVAQHSFGVTFLALDAGRREELLQTAASGNAAQGVLVGLLTSLGVGGKHYSARQLRAWFEEVRGVVTRLYVADPRTLERMGFTGFADDPGGFTHITLGAVEGPVGGTAR